MGLANKPYWLPADESYVCYSRVPERLRPSIGRLRRSGFFPCHSVHLRRSEVPGTLVGRPISICTPEEIHGKTGSAPSGAVLFGPFSANKKKGKGIGDVRGWWNFNLMGNETWAFRQN